MIEVHLYGKLRRFSNNADPTLQSIASAEWQPGSTVGEVIDQLAIPREDIGANIFLNGHYATLESLVQNGDRLGLFPDDMQLLYKWYFTPARDSKAVDRDSQAIDKDSAAPQAANGAGK